MIILKQNSNIINKISINNIINENNVVNEDTTNDNSINTINTVSNTNNNSTIGDKKNYSESSKIESITSSEISNEPIKYDYVLNTNTKKFHKPSCYSVNKIKESNRKDYTGTREEVINKGYKPCKNCNP